MFAESSQVTVLRGGGPGIFPPNAREGDADEQPRGGGGDGQHRGDRRCEGPLVDGSPPAWLQRQVRWLQGPEARAGTLAAPLPPARAGRGPCGSQDILVQCVLCSTSGEGPSAASPGNPKASRSPCPCASPVSQGWCRHQGSPQETLLLWSLLSFHRKGNQLLEMV